MVDELNEGITHLLNQLYSTEIDRTIYQSSAHAQEEIPSALLAIASQSSEARDKVIRALLNALEEDADGGADIAFRIACDLLGKLKAVEAIDTLVKYIDYQPDRTGASLYHKPSVKGLIQIGQPAIPRIEQALEFGQSVLHSNNRKLKFHAVTALTHMGGTKAREALERAYALEKDQGVKDSIEFAIEHIEMAEAKKGGSVVRVRAGDIE